MNWLRIDAATLIHPKVGKLSRTLNCSRREALGIVVSLWCATALSRESGMLDGMDAEDLADVCRWGDDGPDVVAALIAAGWIDETPQGLAVHEWMDYQSNGEKQPEVLRLREPFRPRRQLQIGETLAGGTPSG